MMTAELVLLENLHTHTDQSSCNSHACKPTRASPSALQRCPNADARLWVKKRPRGPERFQPSPRLYWCWLSSLAVVNPPASGKRPREGKLNRYTVVGSQGPSAVLGAPSCCSAHPRAMLPSTHPAGAWYGPH